MTDPVTTETGGLDLAAIRARADAATGAFNDMQAPREKWADNAAIAALDSSSDVDALLAEVERLRRQRQAVLDLLSGEMSGVDLVGGRMAFETVVHWRDRCVLAALGVDHV